MKWLVFIQNFIRVSWLKNCTEVRTFVHQWFHRNFTQHSKYHDLKLFSMRIIHPILIGHFESYSDKSKRGFSPKVVSIFNPTKDGDDDNGASSVAQPNDPPPSRHAIYSVDIQPNMRHHEKSSYDGYTRLATCGGGSKIVPLMTSPIENPLPTTSYNHCNTNYHHILIVTTHHHHHHYLRLLH